MAKKKTKTKKTGKTKAATKVLPQKAQNIPPHDDEEKPFDFGGIPDRDLKKNLGCG